MNESSNYLIFSFQYKSEDTSPVSKYITHPFWNFIVEVSKKLGSAKGRVFLIVKLECWSKLIFVFTRR